MHDLALRVVFGESKVDHLDATEVVGLVEHEILGFDVPV
jgi:hypothetical protein